MTWRDDAACIGLGELFFPTATYRPPTAAHDGAAWHEARTLCNSCDVRPECLEDALQHEEWGMRGGLTPDEQRSLRRKRRREVAA